MAEQEEVPVESTITVGLTKAATEALDQIEMLTEYEEAVIVNRAIQFYAMLHRAKAEGKEIFMADSLSRLSQDP
jgi:hypothetical protein